MSDSKIQKYDFIDALRGWAIIGVVFVHASHWYIPSSTWLNELASQGARGVQLFFLASALTLFLSMEYRRKNELQPTLNYFIRRFFRIAPLFYTGIVFYLFFYGTEPHYWRPNGLEWWHIAMTATFLNALHPETLMSIVPGGWSVADEFMFYAFVPMLFVLLKDIRTTLIALVISIIVSLSFNHFIEALLKTYYPEELHYIVEYFAFVNLLSQVPIFIFGMLNFHILKQLRAGSENLNLNKIWLLIFVMFLATLALYLADLSFVHLVFGPIFLGFSLYLSLYPNKIFINYIVREIGKLSFSMYLTHFVILYAVKAVFPNGFGMGENGDFFVSFFVIMGATIVVSYITYKLIEVPGIKLGKRVINTLEERKSKQIESSKSAESSASNLAD